MNKPIAPSRSSNPPILQSCLRHGCYPAAVTPFREDGEVDQPGMARLIDLAVFTEGRDCGGIAAVAETGLEDWRIRGSTRGYWLVHRPLLSILQSSILQC